MEPVRGSRTSLAWSPDGTTVEKRFDSLRYAPGNLLRYPYERRVGALLNRQQPPVPFARLVGADRRRRALVYEAVEGEPVGAKFPLALDTGDVDGLIDLALRMDRYRPTSVRFVRRFDAARRLRRAVACGALDRAQAAAIGRLFEEDPPRFRFAHGDITARNVMRRGDGTFVLIDWEWFGRYPQGWELAFLWFTVVDAAGARERVEAAIPPADERWFWRSALLVQLLHLGLAGLAPGSPFRDKHLAMRDDLVERVLGE